MTREEALLKLHEYMRFICGSISEKYYGEALHMAISALQQPDHIADDDKKDDHLRDLTKKVDMISRQAAIDAMFSEPLYKTGMKKRSADEVVPAIYGKIKAMPPAQPEQRWIPVGERLPAYGEDVLISIGGYCTVGYIVSVNGIEQYNWFFSGWYHLPDDVDAWMPLPEPYKDDPCNGCDYLGESCVGEGCGKLTKRKEGETDG